MRRLRETDGSSLQLPVLQYYLVERRLTGRCLREVVAMFDSMHDWMERYLQRQRDLECWYFEHEIESTFADCTVGAVEQAGQVAQHRHQDALRR